MDSYPMLMDRFNIFKTSVLSKLNHKVKCNFNEIPVSYFVDTDKLIVNFT